jgi:hypothetical protein
LLSFRGIGTPSLPAQGEQRRSSYFNIRRGNPVERVSVCWDKICQERVCASQRPGGVLASRSAVSRSRDRRLRSGLCECRGKPGVFQRPQETGFAWDCVVGAEGLEPSTR